MCQLHEVDSSDIQIKDPEALKEMQDDGLIEFTDEKWQITERGLPFIRNIAACFDPYYERKTEIKQFSSAI